MAGGWRVLMISLIDGCGREGCTNDWSNNGGRLYGDYQYFLSASRALPGD